MALNEKSTAMPIGTSVHSTYAMPTTHRNRGFAHGLRIHRPRGLAVGSACGGAGAHPSSSAARDVLRR